VPKARHRDRTWLPGTQITLICIHAPQDCDARLAAPNGGYLKSILNKPW
jgi:hypothetical protein